MTKSVIGTEENPVQFSYVNASKAVSVNGGDPKFSVSVIISKSDQKTIDELKQVIQKTAEEYKHLFGGKIPPNLKTPLRDGDTDRPDDEAYRNAYFINANSKLQPSVVDRNMQPIIDPSAFYSGCYGRVSINFYGYNVNGNRGIAAGLQNIMKTADGEPLGGRSSAEADFGAPAQKNDFLS